MTISAILSCILVGGFAWLWRNKWQKKRVHGVLAFVYAVLSWFISLFLGLYIFLEIFETGSVGSSVYLLSSYSFIAAIISFLILRKK